jgi:hypothetical protein
VAAQVAAETAPPLGIRHVFVIVLENKSFEEAYGGGPDQYLSGTLVPQGTLLTQYYGIAHLSNPNYLAMISGQGPNALTQADCQTYVDFEPSPAVFSPLGDGQAVGQGCVYPRNVLTLPDQLSAAGLTWRGYMEDMGNDTDREPAHCGEPSFSAGPGFRDETQSATATDQDAARHNPFVYFHSLVDSGACHANVLPLPALTADLASPAATPSFAFITPDLCSDGHDDTCADPKQKGGYEGINGVLEKWVPKILNSAGFKDDGLLVVSFDEAEDDNASCCGEKAANTPNAAGPSPGSGGGKIGAVLISPFIKPGTVDKTPYNHYSFLRTTEDMFGLPHLGYAGVDGLVPIGDKVFNQTPKLDLSVKARRMNRDHVRFAVDTGRQATVAVSGVCRGTPRPTSEDGKATITVRHSKRGSCRVTVTRPSWDSATRSFQLRSPKSFRRR